MALSGTFAVDGVSAAITGLQGSVEVSVKRATGAKSSVYIQISFDAGVTWSSMVGGYLGNRGVNDTMIASDTTVQYRFKAVGVSGGNTTYYMGQD